MKICIVIGCGEQLSNPTHDLCRKHWQMDREGLLHQGPNGGVVEKRINSNSQPPAKPDPKLQQQPTDEYNSGWYSSTRLGDHFGVAGRRINLILAELGWIEKYVKGWTPTVQGKKLGAETRENWQTGVPYVVWPKQILHSTVLIATVKDSIGSAVEATKPGIETPEATSQPSQPSSEPSSDFREKFPARFRSTDGHMVRSRAEMLIDNWLYMQSIVHAFERKLPIEEEVYCDFYIPQKKVYIEYWGMENDPKYAARMATKKAIYQRYNLNLIELNDDDIMNLDDVLPRRLLKFGIDCT
jgi:hypothetical protein